MRTPGFLYRFGRFSMATPHAVRSRSWLFWAFALLFSFLPKGAFACNLAITPVSVPSEVLAGQSFNMQVRLQNNGPWACGYGAFVGINTFYPYPTYNYFNIADTRTVTNLDRGQSEVVTVRATAPGVLGPYQIALALHINYWGMRYPQPNTAQFTVTVKASTANNNAQFVSATNYPNGAGITRYETWRNSGSTTWDLVSRHKLFAYGSSSYARWVTLNVTPLWATTVPPGGYVTFKIDIPYSATNTTYRYIMTLTRLSDFGTLFGDSKTDFVYY